MSAHQLSPTQNRIVCAIIAWHGPGLPTPGVLAEALDIRGGESTVRKAMKPLEASGLIERLALGGKGLPKVPRVTDKGRAAVGVQPAPATAPIQNIRLEADEVLNVNPAHCGVLAPVAEEPAFVVERLADVFHGYHRGDQLLIAAGDSMVSQSGAEFSIYPGDRCLWRPDAWPGDGDTVYVEYERDDGIRECTLKDWFLDSRTGLVALRARNTEYSAIERRVDEIIVRGVVLEIIRKLRDPARHEYPNGHTNGQVLAGELLRTGKRTAARATTTNTKKPRATKRTAAKSRKGE